jgi:segregation and condensation protein B
VACGDVLRRLMERQLVKIVGRAEVLGRPMLYGTTRRFLEVFGLSSLDDLPRVEELRSGAAAEKPATRPEGEEGAQEPGDAEALADAHEGQPSAEAGGG